MSSSTINGDLIAPFFVREVRVRCWKQDVQDKQSYHAAVCSVGSNLLKNAP